MVRKLIRNRPEPEIFTLDCPTQQVLDIIGNKWSVIIIYCLAYQTRRYKQLERKFDQVQKIRRSPKKYLKKLQSLSERVSSYKYWSIFSDQFGEPCNFRD
jgi:DNA-binding HxlR family transcriptional regulator